MNNFRLGICFLEQKLDKTPKSIFKPVPNPLFAKTDKYMSLKLLPSKSCKNKKSKIGSSQCTGKILVKWISNNYAQFLQYLRHLNFDTSEM